MKEMVYSAFSKNEILYEGSYDGYPYIIISKGLYPCCYVRTKRDIYKRDNKRVPIEKIKCHNGFAYEDYGLSYKPTWSDHVVIGWEYVHIDDKIGIKNGKAWTTEEISMEAESVIQQLQAIPEEEYPEMYNDSDARAAVKEYLGYFIRKATRAAGNATHIIEMTDINIEGDWLDIWGALMDLSRSVYEADREIEYALSVANELFPHEEDNIPERKALLKPKKPEAKKVPMRKEEAGK